MVELFASFGLRLWVGRGVDAATKVARKYMSANADCLYCEYRYAGEVYRIER